MIEMPRITLLQAVSRPKLDFVLPGLLAGTPGLVVGPGGVGKSFLMLHAGLAVATGRPVASGLWTSPGKGPVTLICGEDRQEIIQERLYWLRQQEKISNIEAEDIDQLMDIRSAAGIDLRILSKTKAGYSPGPFLEQLYQLAYGQRLIVLDPLSHLHDTDENDNGAATRLMQTLQAVCLKTGATIIAIHHTAKGGEFGKESWEASRGASAFTTACRWQVNLKKATEHDLQGIGINDNYKNIWVRVAVVKTNYGPPQNPGILKQMQGGALALQNQKPRNLVEHEEIDF